MKRVYNVESTLCIVYGESLDCAMHSVHSMQICLWSIHRVSMSLCENSLSLLTEREFSPDSEWSPKSPIPMAKFKSNEWEILAIDNLALWKRLSN